MNEDDIKAMQLEFERNGNEGDEDVVQLTSSMSAGSFAMINGGLNPLTDTADDAVTLVWKLRLNRRGREKN